MNTRTTDKKSINIGHIQKLNQQILFNENTSYDRLNYEHQFPDLPESAGGHQMFLVNTLYGNSFRTDDTFTLKCMSFTTLNYQDVSSSAYMKDSLPQRVTATVVGALGNNNVDIQRILHFMGGGEKIGESGVTTQCTAS